MTEPFERLTPFAAGAGMWSSGQWDDLAADDMHLVSLEIDLRRSTLSVVLDDAEAYAIEHESRLWRVELIGLQRVAAARLASWNPSADNGDLTTDITGSTYALWSDELTMHVDAADTRVTRVLPSEFDASAAESRVRLAAGPGGQWDVDGWRHTGIWDCELRTIRYHFASQLLEVFVTEHPRDRVPHEPRFAFALEPVTSFAIVSRRLNGHDESGFIDLGYLDGPVSYLWHPALSMTAVLGNDDSPR